MLINVPTTDPIIVVDPITCGHAVSVRDICVYRGGRAIACTPQRSLTLQS